MNHYLGLLILGSVIFTFIALYWIWNLNEKRKQQKYEIAYSTLKFLVRYGIDDPVTCKNMRQMFLEIYFMPCCNYEKLQVLEGEFYGKFKNAKINN